MSSFQVNSIGIVHNDGEGVYIKIDKEYVEALQELDGFSHLNVIWWFSDFDNKEARQVLTTEQPYKNPPQKMGIFATRSPIRPNPIALTAVEVIDIDYKNGIIRLGYIDANDNTPVLDIKPYTPSLDRVEDFRVPKWCEHWPKSLEESAQFEWEKEFNF